MYYVYRIDSSYDGFTPEKIPERLENNRYLIYNWNQYIDQLERGDIVFTFFTGKGILQGIYLICKIVKIDCLRKKAKGKVLKYNCKETIISLEDFNKIKNYIFTRPRGSVFVIPPLIEPFFNKVLRKEVVSEIEIIEEINCEKCNFKEDFHKCPIFGVEYIINWDKEAKLSIPCIKKIVSPFWIIPKQSWWMKRTYTKHLISKFFYAFKAGFGLYARLFAEGIIIAMERNEILKDVQFDFIINIPLSPDKRDNGELDRVDLICSHLSKLLNIPYLKDSLILTKSISRRLYKSMSKTSSEFVKDYVNFLKWNTSETLDGKNLLIVDDVITDGKTLTAMARKIHVTYPSARLYAATGGIMAKKRNMTSFVIKKFGFHDESSVLLQPEA
jgi:predicted amidophosphoribosyltransferase